jgi:ribosomal protein S18 acetylase RimI-like enzyme
MTVLTSAGIVIVPLSVAHADQVAALHRRYIDTGFLSSLGLRFLRRLYRAIPHVPSGFGYVGLRGERVAGFIACAEHVETLYRQALSRHGVSMAVALFPQALRPSVLRRIIQSLRYPSQIGGAYPPAEVLSIVVNEAARGTGLAAQLMERAAAEFRVRGIHQVKVLVWNRKTRAKRFYEKSGFRRAGEVPYHDRVLDAYVATLGEDAPRTGAA